MVRQGSSQRQFCHQAINKTREPLSHAYSDTRTVSETPIALSHGAGRELIVTERSRKLTDPSAWVDRYGDDLFRFAWKRLQSAEMAEDAVQETFLEAIRVADSFRGASSEKTWLFGILKHKIIDHIRKISRERPIDTGDLPENLSDDFFDKRGNWAVRPLKWGNDPAEVLKQKHFIQTLMQCLRELPKRMAHAFSLRELEQLGSGEIAGIMGVSQNNLGVLLHRARLRLRRCLEINWLS